MSTCVRARTSGCASNIEKTTKPGSHTAGVEGRLWSEVAVASLKHPWDNKRRLPDESGGKDRRATFDDRSGVKKLNILSFALASDARDSHTPVSDQGDCPPPLPALLTQDSMPRERRHLAGVT